MQVFKAYVAGDCNGNCGVVWREKESLVALIQFFELD